MGMRASSEKRIAGAAPHITFHWWGALPKADASMKVYVPKSVSLMLAIVKKNKMLWLRLRCSFCVLECCHFRDVSLIQRKLNVFVSDSWINFTVLDCSYERFTFKYFQCVADTSLRATREWKIQSLIYSTPCWFKVRWRLWYPQHFLPSFTQTALQHSHKELQYLGICFKT